MILDHVPWPPETAARYRASGYWRGQTFGKLLTGLAEAYAERPAVIGETARWTFAELDERAHRLAAGFAGAGIQRGDRVVVQLPNAPEFASVVFGLWRAGALPVFALPAHRASELRHFAEQSEAAAILTVGEHERFGHAAMAHAVAAEIPSVRNVFVVG
ncbi:MAG TPA: AMP-binding protein, partial [Amycolatopsis sp.]|nr:AMP-binding protein [Amycolatopsis sp.]